MSMPKSGKKLVFGKAEDTDIRTGDEEVWATKGYISSL
jgi:hypothetical protein